MFHCLCLEQNYVWRSVGKNQIILLFTEQYDKPIIVGNILKDLRIPSSENIYI